MVFGVEEVMREIEVFLQEDPGGHEEYAAEAYFRDRRDGRERVEDVGEELQDEVPPGRGACKGYVLSFGA